MGVCVAVAALGLSVRVEAQSAPAAQGTVELPAVTVTAASPVAKPKKKAKRTSPPASAPVSGDTAAAAAPPVAAPELQPLPGAIVDDQAFVAVTVATARELEANAGQTLTDALMLKPGISGSTFAPGANRPIIRGLDNYRVRIQENGIATHDVSNLSEDHAIPIDPFLGRPGRGGARPGDATLRQPGHRRRRRCHQQPYSLVRAPRAVSAPK